MPSGSIDKSESRSVPSPVLNALDDIFDAGDEDDYDHSSDKARRLQYLTSTGSKIRKNSSAAERSSFSDVVDSRSASRPSSSASYGLSSISSQYKSPSKGGSRSKMEQQEFVKDSVQSKIVRETAPQIKPKISKTLDFNNFVQKIADRQTQIKLPTAEQVGLASILDSAEEAAETFEEHSVSDEEEEDEVSIEVEEDDEESGEKVMVIVTASKPHMPPPAPKNTMPKAARRSKSVLMDEEDDRETTETREILAPPKQSSTASKSMVSLDDFELDEEENDNTAHTSAPKPPEVTQTIEDLDRPRISSQTSVEESSQTSVTESSLKLEYPPESIKITPGGMKLKTPTAAGSKPSLLSDWLTGKSPTPSSTSTSSIKSGSKTSTKDGTSTSSLLSSPSSSLASLAAVSKSNTKFNSKTSATMRSSSLLLSGELFDENANSGALDPSAAAVSTSNQKKRLVKGMAAKQLFDDEAENGLGSDAEEVEVQERVQASSDEDEGGSSQDEYEAEDVESEKHSVEGVEGDGEAHTGDNSKSRFSTDIFETDDRSVIRSVQMQQEMEREAAEMREMEEMALRRDRRARRIAHELHAEANMLVEDRKMEERLEARRAHRRRPDDSVSKVGEFSESERNLTKSSEKLVSSSVPVTSVEKEWFMDDSDEEDDVKGSSAKDSDVAVGGSVGKFDLESRRRFEALEEQQQRIRLASSSQFLLQDEDSQSILQVIERANTQHSQPSIGNSGSYGSPGSNSMGVVMIDESSMFFGSGGGENSQDSLGGWFDRTSVSFSASSKEHLSKLKSHYKGNSTQLTSSSLLFQRSQDGFENSQDSFPLPSTTSPLHSSTNSATKTTNGSAGSVGGANRGAKKTAKATTSSAPPAAMPSMKRSKSSSNTLSVKNFSQGKK